MRTVINILSGAIFTSIGGSAAINSFMVRKMKEKGAISEFAKSKSPSEGFLKLKKLMFFVNLDFMGQFILSLSILGFGLLSFVEALIDWKII